MFKTFLIIFISISALAAKKQVAPISCVELINHINNRPYADPLAVRIGKSALGKKFFNYEEFIENIFNTVPTIKGFVRAHRTHIGGNPTNQEILEYFIQAQGEIVSKINSAIATITDPEINYFLRKLQQGLAYSDKQKRNLLEFQTENEEFLQRAYSENKNLDKVALSQFKTRFYGELGEFDTAMRLNNVEASNIIISKDFTLETEKSKKHALRIWKAYSKTLDKMNKMTPEEFIAYQKQFPGIFNPEKYEGLTQREAIHAFKKWIKTKEFDLIIYDKGRYYITEVKNYLKKVDLEFLHRQRYDRRKTDYNQQHTLIEIINILGLEDTYDAAVAYRRGIDRDATKELEELGFRVIGRDLESVGQRFLKFLIN